MSSAGKGEKPKPESTAKTEKDKPKPEKKKVPTKLQGERWTTSINKLLEDPEGIKAFREFLEELESEAGEKGTHTKYLDFYLECEDYKEKFMKLEERAKDIFEEYLAEAAHLPVFFQVGADREVGTGGKSVEIGDKLEDEGLEGVSLFDEPQKMVRKKLDDCLYKNFCSDLKLKLKL